MPLGTPTFRTKDLDGHLKVAECRISKANVCPYRGAEIPNWEKLGLDPSRVYRLYRDADALREAASSFEGKPLLVRHIAIDAQNPHQEAVVGTIGKVTYEHPYLIARPILVTTQEAIDLIESEEKRELSSAYRYDAIMTPGNLDGQAYDGKMINIRGNHVAIVSEGRAGPDVHVADELPKGLRDMSNLTLIQRLIPYLRPGANLLALDAALGETPDKSVTTLDEAEKKDAEDEWKTEHGKDSMSADEKEECYERARDKKAKDKKAKDAKAKDDEEEAEDESEEEEKKAKSKDAKPAKDAKAAEEHEDDFKPKGKDSVTKDELDSAVRKARDDMRREMQALAAAREAVKPVVGQISMALDSADDVYKFALDHLGINLKGVSPETYATLFEVHQSATRKATRHASLAMDTSSNSTDFYEEFGIVRAGRR
jgi:hypothetical protein